MSFTIFWNKKRNLSRLEQQKVQNDEKLTFSKVDNPWFLVKKWPCFQNFFSRHYRPGKCLLRYSKTKKHFSRLQKHIVQKVEKLTFSIFPFGFWSKNGHFSKVYFLGNIGQENVFYDILQFKSGFLGYKNKKFKTSKNWHFSHGFGPKIAIFPNFFLGIIPQENVFYDILDWIFFQRG